MDAGVCVVCARQHAHPRVRTVLPPKMWFSDVHTNSSVPQKPLQFGIEKCFNQRRGDRRDSTKTFGVAPLPSLFFPQQTTASLSMTTGTANQEPPSSNNNNNSNSNNNNNNSNSKKSKRRNSRRRPHKKPPYPKIVPFVDDRRQSKALETELADLGIYESQKGLDARRNALCVLEEILNQWCKSLRPFVPHPTNEQQQQQQGEKDTSSENNSNTPRAHVSLVSIGSYRLGVHLPNADVDVVALCPPHCTRLEFFSSLVKRLLNDPRITNVHPIEAAYTPVIKFVLEGINIDLLFARLASDTKLIQHQQRQQQQQNGGGGDYVIDDSDLLGLDEVGVRSLNGARVAQLLLETVPNLPNFRTTLLAVKEWAMVHGLYSNVLGFLGGINYAILVACICKRHRDAKPATLLKAFFKTFGNWNWPTPVSLPGGDATKPPPGVMPLPVWDAKSNPRDRHHLMPILTPAYPAMNSAYNVGIAQQRRMTREFRQASAIMQGIEQGRNSWSDLFQGDDFFRQHQHFLQVNALADDSGAFLEWFRLVEARLRLLIAGLESPKHGIQVEPFARFFEKKYDAEGYCVGFGKSDPDCKHEACFFVALRFSHSVESADLRFSVAEFLHKVESWPGRREGMDVTIERVIRDDLPEFVLDTATSSQYSVSSDDSSRRRRSNSSTSDDSEGSSSQRDFMRHQSSTNDTRRLNNNNNAAIPTTVTKQQHHHHQDNVNNNNNNNIVGTTGESSKGAWVHAVKHGEATWANAVKKNGETLDIQSPTKRAKI